MQNFNYNDFITGEKIQELATFIYLPGLEIPDNNCIVFCKTDYLSQFIPLIEQKSNEYILISHNSDGNIVSNKDNIRPYDYYFDHFPKNIKIWFAQNVDVYHEKLVSIPIGLENERWFPELQKKKWILEFIENPTMIKKDKLIYINLNIETNLSERLPIYNKFINDDFVTIVNGKNGSGFLEYRNGTAFHKFSICGLGNGLDTHRIYESLLLRTIPIVRNKVGFNYFKDNFDWPIYLVDDYLHLNYYELNDFYENNKHKFDNYTKFTFDYFKQLIIN